MKIRFIFRYKFSIEKINLIGRFWLDEMSRQKGEKKGQEKTKKNRTLYWPAIEKLSCLFWGGKKKTKDVEIIIIRQQLSFLGRITLFCLSSNFVLIFGRDQLSELF
jgi:hypothetical protein